MKKLRIFISSPGDVQQERLIAKKVIADLNKKYSQYVELETIMWEDLPLEATASFQDGINYFLEKAPIDIAIFILWLRLGSKLGQSYKKPDGSDYQSGTEYEFDMMFALWEQTKRPKIMVYVKNAEPQYTSLSLGDIQEALEQKKLLQNFIEENFRDRETGTNYAYGQFDKQQTFEERLKAHLTRLIQEQIGENVHVKEWEGDPYVGLRSYEETEECIFWGRQSLKYDIVEHWIQQTDTFTQKPLLILGESGSGKSSLVKAGLIPYLRNMSTDKQTYKVRTIVPSEFRGNVYQGFVKNLLESFPYLGNNPVGVDLIKGIHADYDFKYLQFALSNAPNDDITVFFFDQFEELFNDNLITEDEKKKTLQLLHGLCSMPRLWLIISMRNDFYSKFTAYSEFGALKNEAYVVDVPNVSATDIAEIVEIPAEMVNLSWEVNDQAVSLKNRIIQEANELKDLPLIEFGLSELYNSKSDDKLTFSAYEKMGKLKGAVAKYADKFYETLTEEEKLGFEQLLGAVITISSQDENQFARKTTLLKDLATTEAQNTLIKKLTDAHLFVTGRDSKGEPTITIVHETLLSTWDVVRNWIEKQKVFIQKNDHYESLAKIWNINGRKDKNLIKDKSWLLECEYFLFKHENHATKTTCDFLKRSIKKDRRNVFVIILYFILLLYEIFNIKGFWLMIQGRTIGNDFNDFIDDIFDSTPDKWYYFIANISYCILIIHALLIRLIGKPKYKTIRFTFYFTMFFGLFYLLGFIAFPYLDVPIRIILLFIGISIVIDYRRRLLWKKGIFKPYLLSDRIFHVIRNILIFICACILFFGSLFLIIEFVFDIDLF